MGRRSRTGLETNRVLEAIAMYRVAGYRDGVPLNAEPYAHPLVREGTARQLANKKMRYTEHANPAPLSAATWNHAPERRAGGPSEPTLAAAASIVRGGGAEGGPDESPHRHRSCQGHQMCAIAAPEVFGGDDYGNAVVLIEGDGARRAGGHDAPRPRATARSGPSSSSREELTA